MLHFALIGAGFMGNLHAANLAHHPSISFDFAADIDEDRARAVLMELAAAAGKAIYCEKPIGLDLARAKHASRAVERAGVPFMIGFNRRFDPGHVGIEEAIDEGEIGRIEIVQLTSRGPTPPSISYVEVSGGQTRMAAGALCQIDCSRRTAYGYDERLAVFGSLGMVESRRRRVRDVSLYEGRVVIEDGMHPGWLDRVKDTYRASLDGFVRRLLGGDDLALPSLRDGLAAQTIADAATASLRSGLPVRLDG